MVQSSQSDTAHTIKLIRLLSSLDDVLVGCSFIKGQHLNLRDELRILA
jgi:hypothetical protein